MYIGLSNFKDLKVIWRQKFSYLLYINLCTFQLFHLGIVSYVAVSCIQAFVVNSSTSSRNKQVEESEVKIEEVKVTYDNELESIVKAAADDGNIKLLKEIFNNEVRVENTIPSIKTRQIEREGVSRATYNIFLSNELVTKYRDTYAA